MFFEAQIGIFVKINVFGRKIAFFIICKTNIREKSKTLLKDCTVI